jgi:hypothetical protein
MPSWHVAPFLHGLSAQSSMFCSQFLPSYPLPPTQVHVYLQKKEKNMKTRKLVSANESMSEIGRSIRREEKILLVDAILTCCPIFARALSRAVCAIVNVLLAVFAVKPDRTLTGVLREYTIGTHTTILAWVGSTHFLPYVCDQVFLRFSCFFAVYLQVGCTTRIFDFGLIKINFIRLSLIIEKYFRITT